MCRRLPNGTYKYCPSRQPSGARVPSTVVDAIVTSAHTGTPPSPAAMKTLTARAAAPMSAQQKWQVWTGITAGSSVSAALATMRETGWLQQFPELAALDGVAQDPYWHPEGDVLVHAGLTGDHMARQCDADNITGDERTLLVMAATFHDLGKATHTHVEDDGRITSHGHDTAGVAPAHRLLAAMDAPKEFHDQIEPLIKEHMCAVQVHGKPRRTLAVRLQRRLAPATLSQWVRVVNADHGGRGAASEDGYADAWLAVVKNPEQVPEPAPPALITGRDLIAAGVTPGDGFRAVLEAARRAQDNLEILDEEMARRWLRKYLAEHPVAHTPPEEMARRKQERIAARRQARQQARQPQAGEEAGQ
jgi:tRNA nucleotidyltransferase (CCA-adding enzyme)